MDALGLPPGGDTMSENMKDWPRTKVLARGLYLALTAPSVEKAQAAAKLAERVALGMTVDEVELAKTEALRLMAEDD